MENSALIDYVSFLNVETPRSRTLISFQNQIGKGQMAVAFLVNGELDIKVYKADEVVTVAAGHKHNIYLPKDCVIHTIKHGQTLKDDWVACDELDKMIKEQLSEQDILSLFSLRSTLLTAQEFPKAIPGSSEHIMYLKSKSVVRKMTIPLMFSWL